MMRFFEVLMLMEILAERPTGTTIGQLSRMMGYSYYRVRVTLEELERGGGVISQLMTHRGDIKKRVFWLSHVTIHALIQVVEKYDTHDQQGELWGHS